MTRTGRLAHRHIVAAAWPYVELDVDAVRSGGWKPSPLREFVLKIHQRCNLACDYCYMYTMADQSWRTRPKIMSMDVVGAAARRIAEHAMRHDLVDVTVIFHGGEPLLVGTRRILEIVDCVQSALPTAVKVGFSLQTNGVLLDAAMLEAFGSIGLQIGVSLDGPMADHDRHRIGPSGVGSYAKVERALSLLSNDRYRNSFAGLLATVDPRTNPLACYEALLSFSPPLVDFLLPHSNWSIPHPAVNPGHHPFGDWLTVVFDRWYDAPVQEVKISIFEQIIDIVLGGESASESVGLSPVVVAVVESDGAIEQADSLKSAYAGAASTGLSVFDHSFDQALEHPGFVARQLGTRAMSDTCLNCELHRTCGGGLYTHRYRSGAGFRNPSVYCADLGYLITHIQRRVHNDLEAGAPAFELPYSISTRERWPAGRRLSEVVVG